MGRASVAVAGGTVRTNWSIRLWTMEINIILYSVTLFSNTQSCVLPSDPGREDLRSRGPHGPGESIPEDHPSIIRREL